jgi:hypothetical protein
MAAEVRAEPELATAEPTVIWTPGQQSGAVGTPTSQAKSPSGPIGGQRIAAAGAPAISCPSRAAPNGGCVERATIQDRRGGPGGPFAMGRFPYFRNKSFKASMDRA